MHSSLKAIHSVMISLTPITFGVSAIKTLKLQEKVSSRGVKRKSFLIRLSGFEPRLRSIVIFSPSRPVSSLTSEISLILPSLTSAAIFSIITSLVVVGGIFLISMQLYFLSYSYFARILIPPRPVS